MDTVIGIPDSRTEIVLLRPPDGGTRLELSSFVRPDHQPGSPAAMANELGLRNVAFEVEDLQAAVHRLAADGYRLVGGIGQYEHTWRMAYVRGPEGIIVSLAELVAISVDIHLRSSGGSSTSNAVAYGTAQALRTAIAGEVPFPVFRADPPKIAAVEQRADGCPGAGWPRQPRPPRRAAASSGVTHQRAWSSRRRPRAVACGDGRASHDPHA